MSIESIPAKGYFVRFAKDAGTQMSYRHKFCGPNDLRGASCPNCNKPLLVFLSLDVRDPKLEILDSPFDAFPLLFCWTCNIAQVELFSYRVLKDGSVYLLDYGEGGAATEFPGTPYDNYPDYFPSVHVTLEEISDGDQEIIKRMMKDDNYFVKHMNDYPRLSECSHQIGGEPFLVQPLMRMNCPLCGKAMPFFASIGDDSGDNTGFTKNPYVQVIYYYCRNCHLISSYAQCD